MRLTRWVILWCAGLAVALSTGCSGKRSLSPEDLDRARNVVETALGAWQKGERPEALLNHEPSIKILDDDWKKGLRLVRYEVTDTINSASDPVPRCQVRLTLRDRRGKQIEKRVVYQVESKNPITIVRDPYF